MTPGIPHLEIPNPYTAWFSRIVWIGIGVNISFVIPLLFFPDVLLNLLHMQIPMPMIWVRVAGLLLLEVSLLCIPVAIAPFRYPTVTWLALMTRGSGASFFIIAVLCFAQDWGFLTIAVVDLFIGMLEVSLLYLAIESQTPETASNS